MAKIGLLEFKRSTFEICIWWYAFYVLTVHLMTVLYGVTSRRFWGISVAEFFIYFMAFFTISWFLKANIHLIGTFYTFLHFLKRKIKKKLETAIHNILKLKGETERKI